MNIQQAKALFFAQHLGQKVIYKEWNTQPPEVYFLLPSDLNSCADKLLLKSVGDLSDEEKINIAKLVCGRHNRHYKESEITYEISQKREFDINLIVNGRKSYVVQIDSDGVGFVDYFMGGAGRVHYYAPAQFAVTDYYRSIGVLIPFTYIDEAGTPITLSPEEIIALNWAKYELKEGKV